MMGVNENIIDFQKFKKDKEAEKSHRETIERSEKGAEQKEEAKVFVRIGLGNISDIAFYSINDFLGENYIFCQAEKEGGVLKLSFPNITEADLKKLEVFLKEKKVDFKIEKNEAR